MKRNLLLLIMLLCIISQSSNAQFLNKLKKKAEAAVNKAIDETPASPQKPKQQPAAEPAQEAETQPQAAAETKPAALES